LTGSGDGFHARWRNQRRRGQHQKGVEATHPDTDTRSLICARRIVNKMLACLPYSEYGLDSFKEKPTLKIM
jgi:hypothetical protein